MKPPEHDPNQARAAFWELMESDLERADRYLQNGDWAGAERALRAATGAGPLHLRGAERSRVEALLARTGEVLRRCRSMRDRAGRELELVRAHERYLDSVGVRHCGAGRADSAGGPAWLSERA